MQAIKEEHVRMRPRWQFLLYSALMLTGCLILLLLVIYVVSLAFFLLRASGALAAPLFGMRGLMLFARAIPTFLVGLTVVFLVVLYGLVRQFSFFYRTPVVAVLVGIVLFVLCTGFLVERTSIHHHLAVEGNEGHLPPPLGFMYAGLLHPKPPAGAIRGEYLATSSEGFIMGTEDGTTTIIVSRFTRLPLGADFAPGDQVEVIGDRTSSGTVQAFGVIKLDE